MATKKAASTTRKKAPAKKAVVRKKPAVKKQTTKKAKTVTKKVAAKKPVTKKTTAKSKTSKKTVLINNSKRGSLTTSLKAVTEQSYLARLIAEFIGTFILASVVIVPLVNGNPFLAMFALAGIVLILGRVSGAYVNPALTIGAWATKRISGLTAIGYVIMQLAGGYIAFAAMSAFLGAAPEAASSVFGAAKTPQLFELAAIPENKEWFVFAAEALGTFLFGAAVASATFKTTERSAAAFTVGVGFFIGALIAGSAATFVQGGVVLNPAVALALQSFSELSTWSFAIYGAASVLGATLGFVVYDLLHRSVEAKN